MTTEAFSHFLPDSHDNKEMNLPERLIYSLSLSLHLFLF